VKDDHVDETSLSGVVDRVVFTNAENGFTVLRVRVEGDPRLATVVGALPPLSPGEAVRFTGAWVNDRRFGRQFQAREAAPSAPTTTRGIARYLASGSFAGVGEEVAQRLVDAFGENTLRVIEETPERLLEVPGVGPTRAASIRDGWRRERGVREVMLFLHGHEISPRLALKIWKAYGARAIDRLRENPYAVAEEIDGIGWRTADRMARSLGVPDDAPARLEAGVLFALREWAAQGHVCVAREPFEHRTAELLETDPESVSRAASRLIEGARLRERADAERGPLLFLPHLDDAEQEVAADLAALADAPRATAPGDRRALFEWAIEQAGVDLGDRQRDALDAIFAERILIVTGGPGTGKTTLVRSAICLLERLGQTFELAAPTGRAAKRLSEATGRPARTLHRLLEWDPRTASFARGRRRVIDAGVVIVDEASMVDLLLMRGLTAAIAPGTLLVLVGDTDQLPPVGPGNVLRDVIASDVGRVVHLDRIYRQAERSAIVRSAHRINRGEMPEIAPALAADAGAAGEPVLDFRWIESNSPADSVEAVRRLVTETLAQEMALDFFRDVQVLSPMHRGVAGVENLNAVLQQAINPDGRAVPRGDGGFRLGDKVMQIRNDYQKEVWNGDVGRVSEVDEEARRLVVDFDGRAVDYEWEELDALALAYACSVHKAQGSEYRAVILPLHMEHYIMLRRNLLYTAVTRGREWVFLIGERRALSVAVRNVREDVRATMLSERIRAASAGLHA
jgi:exodeoxyribonuclease V alpha subunit